MSILQQTAAALASVDPIRESGTVISTTESLIESAGPGATIGEMCQVLAMNGKPAGYAEVIGFRDKTLILMPLEELENVGPGSIVVRRGRSTDTAVGKALIGRVVNAMGQPIDGLGPLRAGKSRPITATAPNPLERLRVDEMLPTGIRAIDGFVSIGRGQRVGIMAGSGVGKSVLLGMLARNATADVNVIGLIGERGREVSEFIERDLGPGGLQKSVVVVVTSDEMPLLRKRGALAATAIAEHFRDSGKNVLLLMDSLTRVAMAQREIGLAIGEPPTTRGYTPSTFSLLPKMLERAGNNASGSITGLYTILIEGDDIHDPIGDAARSILDGHIVLSRDLAAKGHYPAIDVLQSVSRVMPAVVNKSHLSAAQTIRDILATYAEAEDLINIGAYQPGSNPRIDFAIQHIEDVRALLVQGVEESTTIQELMQVMGYFGREAAAPPAEPATTDAS